MTKYTIILNPISGRGNGERCIPMVRAWFAREGISYDLVSTDRPGHAVELAIAAVESKTDVVVAVGGDGTANEVLNGLMIARQTVSHRPAFGIVSVGRGNDLAYGMGIPRGVEAGLRVLVLNHRRRMDVGVVIGDLIQNGLLTERRFFGNGIGVGFDAVVGFEALKLKKLHGFLSYIVAALRTIFLYDRASTIRIEYNGEHITQPALMVSVMNGRRMGGGFMMAPHGMSDDGLFDVCIAGQVSRLGILALIPRFIQGTQLTHPAIRTLRTSNLTISAVDGTLPAHADGETLCTSGKQLTLELLPAQMDIICEQGFG